MLPALDLRPLGFAPLSSYALFTELLLSSQTCKRRRAFVNHFFCSLYSFLAASSAVCQAVALLVAVAALCRCPWRCGLQVGLVAEPGAERCSSGAAAWWVLTDMTWRCEKCSSSVLELWGAAYLGISVDEEKQEAGFSTGSHSSRLWSTLQWQNFHPSRQLLLEVRLY